MENLESSSDSDSGKYYESEDEISFEEAESVPDLHAKFKADMQLKIVKKKNIYKRKKDLGDVVCHHQGISEMIDEEKNNFTKHFLDGIEESQVKPDLCAVLLGYEPFMIYESVENYKDIRWGYDLLYKIFPSVNKRILSMLKVFIDGLCPSDDDYVRLQATLFFLILLSSMEFFFSIIPHILVHVYAGSGWTRF